MRLANKIEAVLFLKSESVSKKRLIEILNVSEEDFALALAEVKDFYKDRGIVLLENNQEYTLGTSPELSALIEGLQKEELNKALTKASLETLSIILYKNGATRAEIDYIRGVNSSFTLRALSVRGLVEKILDPKDSRKYLYKPTFELLSFMGVTNVSELPEYNELEQKIKLLATDQTELNQNDIQNDK